ncbi:hypothetical protein ACFV2B_15015 [Streptomyces lavendulae]|uniref:hypothetical protein n=1 Tax=Streptomyces lavendulae TaxID=1914 RepID=UPI0036AAFE13
MARAPPSPAWQTKHGIKKQDDGSFRVYCADRVPFVPAERLHDPLRTFAGPLYDSIHQHTGRSGREFRSAIQARPARLRWMAGGCRRPVVPERQR